MLIIIANIPSKSNRGTLRMMSSTDAGVARHLDRSGTNPRSWLALRRVSSTEPFAHDLGTLHESSELAERHHAVRPA
jgi:hypothetical protein